MARKTFWDIVNSSKVDTGTEIRRIDCLLTTKFYFKATFIDIIKLNFEKFPFKGRCLDLDDFLGSHRIKPSTTSPSIEEMFIWFEFLKNTTSVLNNYRYSQLIYPGYEAGVKNYQNMKAKILLNMDSVLDELNYKFQEIEKDKFIIVEKSEVTSTVSEIYPDIAPKIIEYKRFNLSGNLERKRELILGLSHKFEEISDKLRHSGYDYLSSEAGSLLNNLNIRHNNVKGKNEKAVVINMPDKELEIWYDRTYDAILLALMTAHYVDYKPEIKGLNKLLKTN